MRSVVRAAVRLGALVAVAALGSACGSDDAGDAGSAMGEPATAATATGEAPGATVEVTTTVQATTEAAPAEPPASFAAFRTPSKNIACAYFHGSLRCDIASGLNPQPTGPCDLDWVGFVLERVGPGTPQCAGDTVYESGSPILEYGDRWRRGGITCVSRETGLRCTNAEGHGFSLSRARSRGF